MARLRSRSILVAVLVVSAMLAASCGSAGDGEATAALGVDGAGDSTVAVEVEGAVETNTVETNTADSDTAVTPDDELVADPELARQVAIDEITAVLVDWQQRNGAPAVSLSVRLPGHDPIDIANGVVDIVSQEPVTTDDYFRIGSITKPMTAAVVLQLVDEGLIELDAPVRRYLPGWLEGYEYAEVITIRQLMDHTNGLVEYALSPVFYAKAGQRLDEPMAPEEIIEWLAQQQPLFAPGEQYSYETGGFLTLGRVIEAVTGNSAAAEMRARIFEPAGAEHIYLTPEEFPPESTPNAYGRDAMYLAGTTIIGREDTAGLTINDEPVVDMLQYPQDVLQSSGWTGGGNEARLESVSAIMRAMFDGTILDEQQVAEMTTTVLDSNYGLGISVTDIDGVTQISHGGGVPGFRSHGAYLPDHDIAWAVSVNLIPLPDGAGVGDLADELTPLLVELGLG